MSILDNYLQEKFSTSKDVYLTVFQHFDKNRDGYLDEDEFKAFLTKLFHSQENSKESLTSSLVSNLLSILDLDEDGKLGPEDFKCAWKYWLKQILKPVKALVIVDVQNDFISGTLSLSNCPSQHDGKEVVGVINKLLDADLFDVVVYTYDWHPEDHISFIENIHNRPIHSSSKVGADEAHVLETVTFDIDSSKREQIMWPKHCVQKSWGSELHPDLKVVPNAFHVQKGMNSDVDSYSAFWDNDKLSQTNLASILKEKSVTDVYVCGLAYDVCVGFTAHHSVEHGFRTIFIEDACRGVSHEGMAKVKVDLMNKGVHMADYDDISKLTRCEHRPISLAVQAAVNYKLAWEIVCGYNKQSIV